MQVRVNSGNGHDSGAHRCREPVPGLPQQVTQIMAAIDEPDSPIPMDETARTFSVRLTRFEDFA
jgi:hypothetical protein